jgi:TatD DNase family protein
MSFTIFSKNLIKRGILTFKMILIDVHAHLSYSGLIEGIDEVISKCQSANVKVIINQGTEPKSNRESLDLAKKYSIVKPALGFYPTHIAEYSDEEIEKELDFIEKTDCIAIGEVGLDFFQGENHEHKNELNNFVKENMIKYFKKLIQISIKKDIPIIVHSRKAELETIETLEEMKAKKVIMHCYSGKKKYIQRILDNGWFFSIPTNVERALHFHYIIKVCPLNKLFTETDAPFLAPNKDEINDSSNVLVVINKIAEIKNLNPEEVANNIYLNYKRLFE